MSHYIIVSNCLVILVGTYEGANSWYYLVDGLVIMIS